MTPAFCAMPITGRPPPQPSREVPEGRAGNSRANQRTGTRSMDDDGAGRMRRDAEPLGHCAVDWRVEWRIRRRRRFPYGSLCARQRWRRLYPRSGKRMRSGGSQADARPSLARTSHRRGMGRVGN